MTYYAYLFYYRRSIAMANEEDGPPMLLRSGQKRLHACMGYM